MRVNTHFEYSLKNNELKSFKCVDQNQKFNLKKKILRKPKPFKSFKTKHKKTQSIHHTNGVNQLIQPFKLIPTKTNNMSLYTVQLNNYMPIIKNNALLFSIYVMSIL